VARRYWKDESPIGRRINVGNNLRVIIGVVGDVRFRGLERNNEPQVYCSWKQPNMVGPIYAPKDLAIRTAGDPMLLAAAMRRIIHAADTSQPVINVRPLEDIVEAGTASRRVQLGVLGAFGAIAFLLAAVGIHGLLSFAVSSRTQEIGVRLALGARRGNILAMVMGSSLRLAAMGIVLGALLAWTAGRLLEALLAGVKPSDAPTFCAAAALALIMTLAGSAIPAWRALRIDPTVAIRTE
jgi:putative ABC transport system permease protein